MSVGTYLSTHCRQGKVLSSPQAPQALSVSPLQTTGHIHSAPKACFMTTHVRRGHRYALAHEGQPVTTSWICIPPMHRSGKLKVRVLDRPISSGHHSTPLSASGAPTGVHTHRVDQAWKSAYIKTRCPSCGSCGDSPNERVLSRTFYFQVSSVHTERVPQQTRSRITPHLFEPAPQLSARVRGHQLHHRRDR